MKQARPMYLRFVCFQMVEGQRNRLGLFQALDDARQSDFAPSWALKEITETYAWFGKNLAVPPRAKLGSAEIGWQSGLSWFKSSAVEHIQKMHGLKLALQACGVHVEVLTTRAPGIVVWEDRHQIVAKPGKHRF